MLIRTFKIFLIMMFTIGFLSQPVLNAGSSQPSEYQIKAAFLYNFANFVEWPESAFSAENSPIVLGVLGKDPFGRILKAAEGKKIQGRKLTIKRFDAFADLEFCHILFICSSEKEEIKKIIAKIDRSGVLTVGDTDGFTENGGIINFFKADNKVRFEINMDSAKAGNLVISSKLLSLARIKK